MFYETPPFHKTTIFAHRIIHKTPFFMKSSIRIERWRPEYTQDYIRLNKAWIERYFRLEPSDLNMFDHPKEKIIDHGGELFFALDGTQVVGCCALVHHEEDDSYELAKMAVDPAAQSGGIGTLLATTMIEEARRRGVPRIHLEGNTKLEASIALYRKVGFREVPMEHVAYDRCDICMELDLSTTAE
jgi:GNAT superfamily N-acetyltransferase